MVRALPSEILGIHFQQVADHPLNQMAILLPQWCLIHSTTILRSELNAQVKVPEIRMSSATMEQMAPFHKGNQTLKLRIT